MNAADRTRRDPRLRSHALRDVPAHPRTARGRFLPFGFVVALLVVFLGGCGSHGGDSLHLVSAIGLAIVSAAVLAILFNFLRIPALLAYILAGTLLGVFMAPFLSASLGIITHISHLGLVFLLFIIGLEMDIGGILRLGPRTALVVLLQAPIAIAATLGLQAGAQALGFSIPGLAYGSSGFIYFAVAASLGSTAVVVKLLGDQFDLGSKAGRLTVLTLIAEDIWAVLALSYVLSQAGQEGDNPSMIVMFGGGVALAVTFFLFTRGVLSRLADRFSKSPDMLALMALGWCFLCAESFSMIGLSAEMGALVAGLTIGRLPHHVEIQAKVSSLRDFFMALFFVALGMTLPLPTMAVMGQALALVGLVVLVRLLLFTPTLLWARSGPIVSLTTSINLSQLSEFSLLLIPIGLTAGALSTEEGMVISYALMLSVVLTGFTLTHNYRIAAFLSRVFGSDSEAEAGRPTPQGASGQPPQAADIVMLGYFLNAEALAKEIFKENEELFNRILVIDYNLQNHSRIRSYGFRVAYGDIGNPETLRHHGIVQAKIILLTINNPFLRGISNRGLLEEIRRINPAARVIVTADSEAERDALLGCGAFRTITPPMLAAPAYLEAIHEALREENVLT